MEFVKGLNGFVCVLILFLAFQTGESRNGVCYTNYSEVESYFHEAYNKVSLK